MKAKIDCIACILKQGLNAARRVTSEKGTQRKVQDRLMEQLLNTKLEKTPAEHSNLAYEVVQEVTGAGDPFANDKKKHNRIALEVYPQLKQIVEGSDDRLHTALKMAAAGNTIDLGIGHQFDIEADLKTVLTDGFSIDDYEDFKNCLKTAGKILYIGDNCGEIVFDRVLVEELLPKKVDFVVKGAPIINDATLEDARQVGLDKICNILTTADNSIGLPPSAMTPELREAFETADMIISKGQGNFETLSDAPQNIFFILKAKCGPVAKELGVKFGQVVMVNQKNLPQTQEDATVSGK